MKRILTIQDISCFGKCSITIALPVLSAMGIETAVLPTALLSTHTMFPDYIKMDLTDMILSFAKQWKDNGAAFDAIYTGYLGTVEDIELVMNVIDLFRDEDTLLFVDPVFGDHGRAYAGISEDYAAHCSELCRAADYAVPNITEACLMTGMEYKEKYDESYITELAQRVCSRISGPEPGDRAVFFVSEQKDRHLVSRYRGSVFLGGGRRIGLRQETGTRFQDRRRLYGGDDQSDKRGF